MGLKHHKLFIHDHINSRELSEVYFSNLTDSGRLFILLELPKNKVDQQPLIDEIINEAATYFETSQQEDSEMLLEEILHQLNQILPDISASSKIKNWLATIDMAVGIIKEDEVFLAGIGNINAILVQHNQLTPILDKNIEINPSKIFADIISGSLDQGDVLMVSTDALFDYISKEKIKQITKQYSPQGTVIKVNELLETVPDFVSFNSVFIKNATETDREAVPETRESIEEKEEPILVSDTHSSHNPAKSKFSSPDKTKTKTVVDIKGFKNIGFIKKLQKIFALVGLFFAMVGKSITYVGNKIKAGFLFLFSRNYRQKTETETLDSIKHITDKKVNWWQALSLKKKIALGGFFVVLLVFLQSLVMMTQQKDVEQKNQAYEDAFVKIEENYNEMEAKLIYNDEEAAEELLLENFEILDNLKASSPEQEQEIAQKREELFYKLNKVRHINVIPEPAELFNMADKVVETRNIVQKDGKFYILSDSRLYLIEDNNLSLVADLHEGQSVQSMTDWPNENKIVMSTMSPDKKLSYSIFDLDKKETVAVFEPITDNTEVSDLSIYGNNLYVLDSQNSQIFKYPESGNGFGGGLTWLQEEVDLSNASSLTIDGSIYTIDNDGTIRNFLKGAREDFDYHEPRPTIGKDVIIKTFKDSDYLYIIDPQNMRIVILDKEGNIKDQYASQKFDNLVDLAIDPEEKAIYLLNGEHLYLLAINE
ncbi:hypothetical protein C0580_04100 [Candidatus Parcubacteria bacterium]|nr:MAG: hypothetical protein C0580_04100 [Candidatus Parcubacteria bacterium]